MMFRALNEATWFMTGMQNQSLIAIKPINRPANSQVRLISRYYTLFEQWKRGDEMCRSRPRSLEQFRQAKDLLVLNVGNEGMIHIGY